MINRGPRRANSIWIASLVLSVFVVMIVLAGFISGARGGADADGRLSAAGEAAPSTQMQTAASAQAVPTPIFPSGEPRRLEFRHDEGPGLGALLLRAAGGLVLMTVLALGIAVLAKRYMPAVRGYSADGQSRVQLLESRRLTPKLTLFVVEFEGRRLLLAQSGDRVVELGAGRPAQAGDVKPNA